MWIFHKIQISNSVYLICKTVKFTWMHFSWLWYPCEHSGKWMHAEKNWYMVHKVSVLNKNKRPMGHIAHLRKQFKSINTNDYIITLIKRRRKNVINFIRVYWFFIWTNLNPLHPRMLCANFGWNWTSGSGEEDFKNFVNVFLLFHNYLPLEKGGALHLNKLEFPLPKDALFQVLLKLTQWF